MQKTKKFTDSDQIKRNNTKNILKFNLPMTKKYKTWVVLTVFKFFKLKNLHLSTFRSTVTVDFKVTTTTKKKKTAESSC